MSVTPKTSSWINPVILNKDIPLCSRITNTKTNPLAQQRFGQVVGFGRGRNKFFCLLGYYAALRGFETDVSKLPIGSIFKGQTVRHLDP